MRQGMDKDELLRQIKEKMDGMSRVDGIYFAGFKEREELSRELQEAEPIEGKIAHVMEAAVLGIGSKPTDVLFTVMAHVKEVKGLVGLMDLLVEALKALASETDIVSNSPLNDEDVRRMRNKMLKNPRQEKKTADKTAYPPQSPPKN